MVNNCQCGKPVFIKKTGECQSCYNARYFREHYIPKSNPRDRAGTTPETATPCTYDAAHLRVRRVRGLPSEHVCSECGDHAEEWAYRNESAYEMQGWHTTRKRGGKQWSSWSPCVWDYDPLCRDCHHQRDVAILPRTAGAPQNMRRTA